MTKNSFSAKVTYAGFALESMEKLSELTNVEVRKPKFWSDWSFKSTVVNLACTNLNGRPLKTTTIVPIKTNSFDERIPLFQKSSVMQKKTQNEKC